MFAAMPTSGADSTRELLAELKAKGSSALGSESARVWAGSASKCEKPESESGIGGAVAVLKAAVPQKSPPAGPNFDLFENTKGTGNNCFSAADARAARRQAFDFRPRALLGSSRLSKRTAS